MTINRAHYRVMVAVLLATGLLLLFCGCGGDDKANSTGPEAPAGGSSGNVSVKGLVDDPVVLTAGRLEEMTVIEITVDHPKLGMTDYRGVRLSDLFASLGVKEGAASLTMTASDGYMAEVPLADIRESTDAMLAIGDGGALSVVMPGIEAKSWVKDVVALEFK